jgi:hypothetical protein
MQSLKDTQRELYDGKKDGSKISRNFFHKIAGIYQLVTAKKFKPAVVFKNEVSHIQDVSANRFMIVTSK